LPMPLATGTSLLLIATNSMVALAALGHWPAAELPLMLPLLAGGLLGAIAGQSGWRPMYPSGSCVEASQPYSLVQRCSPALRPGTANKNPLRQSFHQRSMPLDGPLRAKWSPVSGPGQ
ncbi:MAG: hypothetical protein NTW02_03365, partial [Cyanobium sp. LacPavin_0920_WC12_MAG_62_9]|nr:hypothetical protein [Cyanobium sp. LacPavin_0920_WC12_MAG_62_9]